MARPVWTGSISFGLVNVPVKAVTAVRDHDVHFHQLDKKSGSRIRNRKVAEGSGKQVDADDIEMGFEVGKGKYVTFDTDELSELRPSSTRAIEVTDFVPLAEVDPIYFERTYWLVPDGDPAKAAYQLLLAAMEDRERVAIGTVVMRNKQYLAAIRPLETALAMSTMRFADEVVPRSKVEGLPNRRAKPEAKALKMATSLIDALAGDWQPEQYHDTFTEELRRRIKAKDAGKEIVEERGAGADRRQGARPAERPRGQRRRREIRALTEGPGLEGPLRQVRVGKGRRGSQERLELGAMARSPTKQAATKQTPTKQKPTKPAPTKQAATKQAPTKQTHRPSRHRPSRHRPNGHRPSEPAPPRPAPRRTGWRRTARSGTSASPPSRRAHRGARRRRRRRPTATASSCSVTGPGACTTTCAWRPPASWSAGPCRRDPPSTPT